ncbi:unnamed protein product [Lepeophtheirus salmonis]|uniref:(salmon louse) hypothetical protein n=1 Tax=Lepeophtheirus salmonis TaxID=72036 RepID=A0A7R8H195_LEPSM|nr:unnamed protein product [Lepeophtheirus salmonis]CAF2805227.1 unnamed protein product [Lepeophtheirus salmonis]
MDEPVFSEVEDFMKFYAKVDTDVMMCDEVAVKDNIVCNLPHRVMIEETSTTTKLRIDASIKVNHVHHPAHHGCYGFVKNDLWFYGPYFLSLKEDYWPKSSIFEVKAQCSFHFVPDSTLTSLRSPYWIVLGRQFVNPPEGAHVEEYG